MFSNDISSGASWLRVKNGFQQNNVENMSVDVECDITTTHFIYKRGNIKKKKKKR